jgi:hypothetical protein
MVALLAAAPAWAGCLPTAYGALNAILFSFVRTPVFLILGTLVLTLGWRYHGGVAFGSVLVYCAGALTILLFAPLSDWFDVLVERQGPVWILQHLTLLHVLAAVAWGELMVLWQWGCCHLAAAPEVRRSSRSLLAAISLQLIAWVLVWGPALGGSRLPLDVTVTDQGGLCGVSGWVYYLDGERADLWRQRLDGTQSERVAAVPGVDFELLDGRPGMQIGLEVRAASAGQTELWYAARRDRQPQTEVRLVAALPGTAMSDVDPPDAPWGAEQLRDLRPAGCSTVSVEIGCTDCGFSVEGLPHGDLSLRLDTPLIAWLAWHTTILPGDNVVWQLGPNIIACDPHRRELTWLAKGASPIVVLDPL